MAHHDTAARSALRWTTTSPTEDGLYWAEEPDGRVTMVEYHAGMGIFTEMGTTCEYLDATAWVRFSDRPIALPGEGDAPAPQ